MKTVAPGRRSAASSGYHGVAGPVRSKAPSNSERPVSEGDSDGPYGLTSPERPC